MPSYKITAPDTDGREYVYEIDDVDDAEDAAWQVYGYHGMLVRRGEVPFPLGLPYVAEEIVPAEVVWP